MSLFVTEDDAVVREQGSKEFVEWLDQSPHNRPSLESFRDRLLRGFSKYEIREDYYQ